MTGSFLPDRYGLASRAREYCARLWDRAAVWLACVQHRPFLAADWRCYLRRHAPYQNWLRLNRMTVAGRADLEASLRLRQDSLPRISVVMPVYRPDLNCFHAAVASVRDQIYANWELCMCDDGSADPLLADEIVRLSSGEPRIRCVTLPVNRGIAAATNAAAALATGDILLFLDQDDLLSCDCLGEFAMVFADDPGLGLAYSDSDKIDSAGRRFAPSFKPGWSPWLLLSYMYPGHAIAMRRELFVQTGGLRTAFDGSQDYDLLLRASEIEGRIGHIPRVLYHWRVLPGSTALTAAQKPGSIAAGQSAVAEAIARRGMAGETARPGWAEQAAIGLFEWRPPNSVPSAALIVLADAEHGPGSAWFVAITAMIPAQTELIVLEREPGLHGPDGADDGFRAQLSAACAKSSGTFVVCLAGGFQPNQPRWLSALCAIAEASGGLVGPRVVNGAGRVIHAGLCRPVNESSYRPAFAGLPHDAAGPLYLARVLRECAALPAWCLAAHRDVMITALGGTAAPGDAVALGVHMSERVRAVGRPVLVASQMDLVAPAESVGLPNVPARLPDTWCNQNMDCRTGRVRPTGPALRQGYPIRLAVVTHNLEREGAQSTLLDLLEGLQQRGEALPLVISAAPGALGDDLAALDIPVRIIPRPRRRSGRAANDVYRAELADAFRQAGAQAVLANTLDSYAGVNAAVLAGLGVIWWQHEGGDWRSRVGRLRRPERAMLLAAFGQSYRVVQVAEATLRAWSPLALGGNFTVIRNGIPPQRLSQSLTRWSRPDARSSLGLENRDCCVLLLGSVSKRKSQADIISAIALLPADSVANLKVMIVGAFVEPDYQRCLVRMLASLPESHRHVVRLCGHVPDTAVHYAAADIFVCCSRQESAPRAIVEAMAFGLPVLTTPVDGIPELVDDGKSGLFYRPGQKRELAEKVARLAEDTALRENLGQGGRRKAGQICDFDLMVDRFGNLIREAAWQSDWLAPPLQDRKWF